MSSEWSTGDSGPGVPNDGLMVVTKEVRTTENSVESSTYDEPYPE